MSWIAVILIGISLSLDTFSLSLVYGTLALSKKKTVVLSIIVGIYHFIMPLIGSLLGNIIINKFFLPANYIVSFLFMIIAFQMVLSTFKEEPTLILNYFGMLLFGLAVSIDSFITGIGLGLIYNDILNCAFIFSTLSSLFTYVGLTIGGKINQLLGKYSTLLGGTCLLLLAIYYLTI